ncbi:unnamed protein product [Amoebophrya sp. A25]|nr:unnamed protein product [Amoebophrya sp. A25]|eukprot:GSA25T00016453001.1
MSGMLTQGPSGTRRSTRQRSFSWPGKSRVEAQGGGKGGCKLGPAPASAGYCREDQRGLRSQAVARENRAKMLLKMN